MLFRRHHEKRDDDWERRYALYEIAYTCVDFAAALLYITGSVLMFHDAYRGLAPWFFLAGSFFFAMKPTIRLIREIRLVRRGEKKHVAQRYDP